MLLSDKPIPNSPEFSRLNADLQCRILEIRAIETNMISYVNLRAFNEEPEPSEPKNLWGGADAEGKALKRWQTGEKTPT